MSHINEITKNKEAIFINIYNRCGRIATAVFTVANLINQDEDLRTRIKKLSLDLVSLSVSLKDIDLIEGERLIKDIEKNSLLLMSLLDIASLAGLISPMNGQIIKDEFQSFILEIKKFAGAFEENKNISIKKVFNDQTSVGIGESLNNVSEKGLFVSQGLRLNTSHNKEPQNGNGNGGKRKDMRKGTILNFIRGHNNVSIKDIVPNIIGCSEKTVQREIMELIQEGKITKTGERRWSRYFLKQA